MGPNLSAPAGSGYDEESLFRRFPNALWVCASFGAFPAAPVRAAGFRPDAGDLPQPAGARHGGAARGRHPGWQAPLPRGFQRGPQGRYTASVTNPVLSSLLAATVRAGELELEAARRKQKSTGELEAEQARLKALSPEEYPAPVRQSPEPGSVLEAGGRFGPGLP